MPKTLSFNPLQIKRRTKTHSILVGLPRGILFALIFHAFLITIYLLRTRKLEQAEWKLTPPFSLQLTPFSILIATNLLPGTSTARIIVELPIISYSKYDLWYRLITTQKNPPPP